MTTIQIKKDGQDPQVINVPEGAKIIIEDGVTIVEPEFKDGDIVYLENDREVKGIAIFKKYHSINSFRFDYYFLLRIDFNICSYKDWADCSLGSSGCMRYATESEKQQLFDALAKDGMQWNHETRQIEELTWKPKANETYYIPDVCSDPPYLVAVNEVSFLDEICIERNIAFKTQEEAIEIAKKWLQQL